MSDEQHLNPNASPDGLDNPASGVRRMNKLPLIAAGGLAFVVIVTLVFAAQQRANKGQNQEEAQTETVQARSTQAGANALLQGYELDGTIPPAGRVNSNPEPETEEQAAETSQPPAAPPSAPRTASTSAAPPAFAPELSEAEQERQKRARQFREDLFYDAVVSNTTVQVRDSNTQRQADGGLPAGALGAAGRAEEQNRRLSENMRLASSFMNGGGGNGSANLPFFSGTGGSGAESDPNLRARKDEFQQTIRTYGYSTEFRQPQLTPFELRVGSVIPAVMIGGINSDLPGEIIAQVSQNVRDTRTGQHILIPQGSRLIGTYDSHIAMGQRRVMVGWHRVQFPDGSTMELGNMGGTDPAGYAGFTDKVNNHYWRIFGNATLLSIIGAGAQLSQPDSNNNSNSTDAREELAAELGRQWGQVGQEMTKRNMNIQPTLEIRPGYQFNVMVNKDLILEPYAELPTGR